MSVIMLVTECSRKTRQGKALFFSVGKKASSAFCKAQGWCISILLLPGGGVGREERRRRKGDIGGEQMKRWGVGGHREMKWPENEERLSSVLSSGHENPFSQGSSQRSPNISII